MKKRSVKIAGHATSVSLEDEFWDELSRLADGQEKSLNALIAAIDETRPGNVNLSSALRLYVLGKLRAQDITSYP